MNARSIRRAAERKSKKTEAARTRPSAQTSESLLQSRQSAIAESRAAGPDARTSANRANAQLSTGPRTPEGRRISSLNAVKTGLTGQTVLLPSDDALLYEQHVGRFVADHNPETDRERELVQHLADAQWRMNRIPGLEMAIFARGRLQFAEQFAEFDIPTASALTDAETLFAYGRELRNLQTQEGRIRRHYEKDLLELRSLQGARTASIEPVEQPTPASIPHTSNPGTSHALSNIPPGISDLDPNGFEYSKMVEEIENMTPEQMEQEIADLEAYLETFKTSGETKEAA